MSLKQRLDKVLLERGVAPTREKVQALIQAGVIRVNNKIADKVGALVALDADIQVLYTASPFVSRGGEKLKGAWTIFSELGLSSPCDRVALDVGISTGGFTDYLFQNGAEFVFGLDVGYGQVDLRVRQNPKLALWERLNARSVTPDSFFAWTNAHGIDQNLAQNISIVVMDVSFISVTKVLPAVAKLVKEDADFVILIKPQFEAQKAQIGKGGIVRDAQVLADIVASVKAGLANEFDCLAECASPIKGTKGNQEFFFWLKKKPSL